MIYIICPDGTVTGGTEALHQLSDELTRQGIPNAMYYLKDGKPEKFNRYSTPIRTELHINDDDVVVLPEIYADCTNVFGGKVFLWWLSVDNSRRNEHTFTNENVIHLYQSEYAKQYIEANGKTGVHLGDYINDDYFTEDSGVIRRNRVVFNPAKGFNRTAELIRELGGVEWVGIKNMNNDEIKSVLDEAKVYIDLGNHPGMDRLPREACLRNCIVITNIQGASANDVDIPISSRYKAHNAREAYEAIKLSLNDYPSLVRDFWGYKDMIVKQRVLFARDVKKIFGGYK